MTIYVKTGASTWTEVTNAAPNIKVKTGASTWTDASLVYLKTASGWQLVWDNAATPPVFSSSSTAASGTGSPDKSTFTIVWTQPTIYSFQKYQFSSDAGATWGGDSTNADLRTYTWTNLNSSTSHTFGVRTVTVSGKTGPMSHVATTANGNPQPVTNGTTSSILPESATISWTASTSTDLAPSNTYEIWESGAVSATYSQTGVSKAFTGLSQNTAYSFTIFAVDSAGLKSSGVVISFTTTTNATPVFSSSSTAASGTGSPDKSTFTINWTQPTIYSFQKYQFSSDGGSTWSGDDTNAALRTYTWTNLNSSTSYTFGVRTVTTSGVASPMYYTATTANGNPQPVTSGTSSNVLPESATISWTASTSTDLALNNRYEIWESGAVSATYLQNGISKSFIGLSQNTAYSFTIFAVDSAGLKSSGVVISFTTTTNPPPVYSSSTTAASGTGSPDKSTFTINWTQPTIYSFQKYQFSSDGGSTWSGDDTNAALRTYTWTNLNSSTSYTFGVRTMTVSGIASTMSHTNTTANGNPQPVTNGIPSSILPESATISWTASTSTDLAPSNTYEIWESGAVSATYSQTGVSKAFTGLSQNTAYSFTIFAVDSAGLKSSGTVISFTTTTNAPPVYSSSSTAASGTGSPDKSTFTINWTQPTIYSFQKYQFSSNVDQQGGTWSGDSVNAGLRTYTWTNLDSSTGHSFGVRTVTTSGVVSTMTYGLTTTANGNPQPVTNGSASNVLPESATISWTASTSTDLASAGRYEIYEPGSYVPTYSQNSVSKALTGLSQDTAYSFNIFAVDSAGLKSSGVTISFTTTTNDPPVHSSSSTAASGTAYPDKSTFTINWTQPTIYSFQKYEFSSDDGATWIGDSTNAALRTYKWTNLDSLTSYTFGVRTVTTSGVASEMWLFASTANGNPEPVTSGSASSITPTTATISWTASTSTDLASAGRYEIWAAGATTATYSQNGVSKALTGFSQNTEHTYTIFAVDSAGLKSSGEAITFTTTNAAPLNAVVSGFSKQNDTVSRTTTGAVNKGLTFRAQYDGEAVSATARLETMGGVAVGNVKTLYSTSNRQSSFDTTVAFTGLDASTSYICIVTVTDANGASTESDLVAYTTNAVFEYERTATQNWDTAFVNATGTPPMRSSSAETGYPAANVASSSTSDAWISNYNNQSASTLSYEYLAWPFSWSVDVPYLPRYVSYSYRPAGGSLETITNAQARFVNGFRYVLKGTPSIPDIKMYVSLGKNFAGGASNPVVGSISPVTWNTGSQGTIPYNGGNGYDTPYTYYKQNNTGTGSFEHVPVANFFWSEAHIYEGSGLIIKFSGTKLSTYSGLTNYRQSATQVGISVLWFTITETSYYR